MDDLYINLEDGSWSLDRAGLMRNEPLNFNQGDIRTVRLWFFRKKTGPALYEIVRKPTGYGAMHLFGRSAEDLESAEKALFDAGTWTEGLAGSEYYYDATLDLNTSAITAHLGTDTEANVLWQLELSNASPVRRWTIVVRGKGTLYRDIYRASDTPDTEPESYPAPEDIALNTGENYRIVDGVFQLRNTSAGTWHEVHLTGAAGSEQLVISAAE